MPVAGILQSCAAWRCGTARVDPPGCPGAQERYPEGGPTMAEVTIRALKNGPYEVSGGPTVLDFERAVYPLGDDPVYLCRCGRSASKPFCDGAHKKAGFDAPECVRMRAER